MASEKSDDPRELGWQHPSFTQELGCRVQAMLDRMPSRKRAAEVSGKDADTVTKWGKGQGLAQFLALAAIAGEAGVSLDWLATGSGEMLRSPAAAPPVPVPAPTAVEPIDEELLEVTLQGVDEFIAERGLVIPTDRRAALVATIYSLAAEDGAKDLAKKPSAIAKFIRLAAVG